MDQLPISGGIPANWNERVSKLGIRRLGPISAQIGSRPPRLSNARHRAILSILSILVAARGRTVSTGRLIVELWDDAPVGAVETFIAELHRVLEPERPSRTPPKILVTSGDG